VKKNFVHVVLEPGNVKQLHDMIPEKQRDTPWYPLLLAVAEVLDDRAQGEDVFLALGGTKDMSTYLLTVKYPQGKLTAAGGDLVELLADLQRLF
jgi:hypothetical protein